MDTFIGNLLRIESVQSIDGWNASFAAAWAERHPSWVLFGCVALAALALWFYARFQPTNRPKVRALLSVVRALVLVLLVLLLADPILQIRLTNTPRPLLWVLLDGTDSMAIEDEMTESERRSLADATGLSDQPELPADASADPAVNKAKIGASKKRSRADYVKAWLHKKDDNLLTKLEEKFRIRGFLFDRPDGVRTLEWNDPARDEMDLDLASKALTTTGQVTAIGRAFDDLALRHATSNLQGLVVISDFDQNSGPPAAAAAKKLGVPVYTIGVGPTAAVDLAVDLQAPPVMKKAERSTVTVILRQTGLDGADANVVVTARRHGGNGPALRSDTLSIGEKTIEIKRSNELIEFPFTPEETGKFEFVAEVKPLEGEIVDQNNRSTREVNIRDDFLRLMYVEYEPTWEWRFIKEVFHRDKLVGTRGFRTFLRSADPKVRSSNELFLATLTPQRSEFFANDVLFLGDMPSAALSTRFCEMTKEFVEKFGGGLVVIAGDRFGPGQLTGTPLADMLPVVVEADNRPSNQKEFRLQLTSDAGTVDFMQLGSTEAENQKAWNNLGPLPWYQPVARPHPQATVLAVHPTDTCVDGKTPQPLIAIRRYGRGEVVYLAFDETWRLRAKYGELYYRQLWGQMIHRLGLSHALGSQKRFVVRTDRQQYQADDTVVVTAEAYDANFEPLSEEKLAERKLTAQLYRPDRNGESAESQPISLAQLREGVFEARLPVADGGEYRLRVKDPVTREETEIDFQVTSLSAERRSAVRNVQLQDAIAADTAGRSYTLTSAHRLADEIELKPRVEESIKVFSLSMTWLCFTSAIVLMLSEWLVRKLINLP